MISETEVWKVESVRQFQQLQIRKNKEKQYKTQGEQ